MDGSGFYVRDYAELTSAAAAQPWWAMTFDLVVKLGLVIGLIYIAMWLLRTYVGGKKLPVQGGLGGLSVLQATTLSPGRTVYLVEVASRVLVLGATSSSLTTLSEISDPEAIEQLKREQSQPDGPPAFAEQLRTISERLPATFLQDKVGELRQLAERFRKPAQEPVP